jgi:DNA-binding IclR family transcriptional regulator
VGEIARAAGLAESAAHAALARLTLSGYVARLAGERYKRVEAVD